MAQNLLNILWKSILDNKCSDETLDGGRDEIQLDTNMATNNRD